VQRVAWFARQLTNLRAATSGIAAARSSLERLEAEEQGAVDALAATRHGAEQPRRSQQLDLAEDALRLARSNLDRALAQRVEATPSIEVAQGGAAQRGATMLRATLLAPFDGLVTQDWDDGDATPRTLASRRSRHGATLCTMRVHQLERPPSA